VVAASSAGIPAVAQSEHPAGGRQSRAQFLKGAANGWTTEIGHHVVGQPVPSIPVDDFGRRDARFRLLHFGCRASDRLQTTHLQRPFVECSMVSRPKTLSLHIFFCGSTTHVRLEES
jgi:hypothetical protein